jgi:hypothetical protein
MLNKVTVESKGEGMNETMTPVCTCGWRGIGYAAYNNWQHTLVHDQINAHKEFHSKEEKAFYEIFGCEA